MVGVMLFSTATSFPWHRWRAFELGYAKIAFLRMGAGKFQKAKDFGNTTKTSWQPNFGLGVKIAVFRVDYALTDFSNSAEALYSHVFSLSIGLNDQRK